MTSSDPSRPTKRTNVRLSDLRAKARRRGIRWLDRAAPQLAARLAERMFLSPGGPPRPSWEAELIATAKRSTVRYGRLELPTYSWGDGPARVLLLHGWEGRASQLGAFVPKLLGCEYQVIAVDLPGHGDGAPALTSVVDFGRAIAAIVAQLGPFAGIIGHSMGAAAAALAHTFAPFDTRLVLVGAPRSPRSFFDGFARYLGLSAHTKALLEERIAVRFGLSIDAADVERLGGRIVLPTLLIHDRNDKIVPFEHGLALSVALPQATLFVTEQLGHRRILRDEAVIDAAVSFIVRGVRDSLGHDAHQAA